ncbi:MAG: type I restriction enzyme HsdR N-terminal domain-containing protein [Myxococcota bacterium]
MVIITDMLNDIFGYDKYSEVSSEHMIRGTFCDLAIKLENELKLLIEAKAIGIDLKEQHVKQAVDYAVNQGVDWVVLTNGVEWRVYRVVFSKPVENELVASFDMTELSHRNSEHVALVAILSKEGWTRSVLKDFATQQQVLSRYTVAAVVMSDEVVGVIRRQLRRLAPDVRIEEEQLKGVLCEEVMKRDLVEGEKADQARKAVQKASGRARRKKASSRKTQPAARGSATNTESATAEQG